MDKDYFPIGPQYKSSWILIKNGWFRTGQNCNVAGIVLWWDVHHYRIFPFSHLWLNYSIYWQINRYSSIWIRKWASGIRHGRSLMHLLHSYGLWEFNLEMYMFSCHLLQCKPPNRTSPVLYWNYLLNWIVYVNISQPCNIVLGIFDYNIWPVDTNSITDMSMAHKL